MSKIDRDSVSDIYKELLQINTNKKPNKTKMDKASKQVIYREGNGQSRQGH